jgi:hypothetical protein
MFPLPYRRASNEAIKRASLRCPVIKALNKALEGGGKLDARHSLRLLLGEIDELPEAHATKILLERILLNDMLANGELSVDYARQERG